MQQVLCWGVISGNNVDSNKGNIEDINTNKKRFMDRKEKDCRYFQPVELKIIVKDRQQR